MRNLITDPKYGFNTAILCLLWSTSAYSFYFTEFYMKYVPVSNVYYLALMMGFSDMLTSFIYAFISKRTLTKTLLTVCSLLLALFAGILSLTLHLSLPDTLPLQLTYCLSIFGLRFFSALTFMGAY